MRSLFLTLLLLISIHSIAQTNDRATVLRDSTIKFGAPIGPYLASLSKTKKIVPGFNYAPYINKFLKEHKYVKFPAETISIGLDSSVKGYNAHIFVNSGNRLYFPEGSRLVCPPKMPTNGYMVLLTEKTTDVFIDGINLTGSKANSGYKTSPWGAGIALFAPTQVLITNTVVSKSTGDGINVRTNWSKQSRDITIDNAKIFNSTRVGFLVTGIVNGYFKDITIEDTGEVDNAKVLKPQTGLSFEPNDCTSKYVNCKFENLQTKNNLGPVVATANFYHIFANNTCGTNKIDIQINKWTDVIDNPRCYGASLDISTMNLPKVKDKYNTKEITGTFVINDPTLIRNTRKDKTFDYFFVKGKDEEINGGVQYKMNNAKLVYQGTPHSSRNRTTENTQIRAIVSSSRKMQIN